MKLIVGLGNPGERYAATRHNAGFWLVERFAAQTGTALRKDAKFQALVGKHEASGAWLLLPQNFMNASGRPVQMLASFFRIAPADILVAHDELDFPPGTVRLKQGGGAGGHNGLRDVSARLGAPDYWRLRIGIGHPGDRNLVTDYVLRKPAQEERAGMDDAIGRALDVLPLILAGDVQGAMLKLHTEPEKALARPPRPDPDPAGKPQAARAGTAAQAEQPAAREQPAPAQAGSPAKPGALGSFLKKLLPDSDAARKK